jgi:branched-chain amino acid aminotransferase
MMKECLGKKFILNGELLPVELFDNSLVYDGDSVYEVIRMVKGSPVFFYDHLDRLSTSVRLQRKEMLADYNALRRAIITLTRSERKKESNLKIVFNYNNGIGNYIVYFIEPIYPSAEQYKNGVKGILFHAERKNPESKVINHKLRSDIYHRLILEGAYEAILVNEKNMITEGSRSNIFFLKEDTLFTAPDNLILNGITRKHILEICIHEKIRVEFTCISVDEMGSYESVFMTGTSPMVLPFCCIDDKFFDSELPLMAKLRELYLIRAEESILGLRSQ